MNTKLPLIVLLLAAFLVLSFSLNTSFCKNEKIKIAVSIDALRLILKPIVEPYAEIIVLLPEEVDPHLFQASPNIIEAAEQSDLIVCTGHFSFEYKVVQTVKRPYVCLDDFLKSGLVLLTYLDSNEKNIHGYWFLPDNALTIAKVVVQKLSTTDPSHYNYYRNRLKEFEQQIKMLKVLISEENHLTNVSVIISAPVEQYPIVALGLKPVASIMKEHGVFPGAKEIQELESAISSNKNILIISSDLSIKTKSGEIAKQISADTRAPLVVLKLFHTKHFDDYFSLMAYNLGLISTYTPQIKSSQFFSDVMPYIIVALTVIIALESIIIANLLRRRA